MTDVPGAYKDVMERHVLSIRWIRDELLEMDALIDPVMGIGSWDDAVVLDLPGKRLIASTDGPYAKRLVMKSALIHSATDVVVKGGMPLFALDTLIGGMEDLQDMIRSLKIQSKEMRIPLLGGNTMMEDTEPRCSLTVLGTPVTKEPIRDCGAREGDHLVLLGEPLWGSREERMPLARLMFETYYGILREGIAINAAKDVTKGGLISTVYEIASKSGRDYELSDDIPYPMTRNLDNFLLSVGEEEHERLEEICERTGCKTDCIGVML